MGSPFQRDQVIETNIFDAGPHQPGSGGPLLHPIRSSILLSSTTIAGRLVNSVTYPVAPPTRTKTTSGVIRQVVAGHRSI